MSSAANSIRRLVFRASEIPKENERGPAPYMHFLLITVPDSNNPDNYEM